MKPRVRAERAQAVTAKNRLAAELDDLRSAQASWAAGERLAGRRGH